MPVVIKYRASSSVPEGSGPLFACEADALVRVPQYLLETPAHAHAFVLCQVLEESCEPLFQS